MLTIDCPWCGTRVESEFEEGGEAHVVRPEDWTAATSDVDWADYLYRQPNRSGLRRERWVHSAGCGEWFNVLRDTVSHDILEIYAITAEKPASERSD